MDKIVRLAKAKDLEVSLAGPHAHHSHLESAMSESAPTNGHHRRLQSVPSVDRPQMVSGGGGSSSHLNVTDFGDTPRRNKSPSIQLNDKDFELHSDDGRSSSASSVIVPAMPVSGKGSRLLRQITRDEEASNRLRKIFNMGESIGSAKAENYRPHLFLSLYRRIMRLRIPGITGNTRSFYLFSKDNLVRQYATTIIDWSPFEWVILATITANCIVLGLEQRLPREDKKPLNLLLEETEVYFLGIFTIEAMFKVVALGFIRERGSYLRNMWNILDFIVVVTGLIPFFVSNSKLFDLRVLRAVRVLRPLKLVSGIPSLQVVLSSIVRAMAPLIQIALLVLFAILMFAIIGLDFYSGILHQTCMNPFTGESPTAAAASDAKPCPYNSLGQKCSTATNQTLFCMRYWVGPNYGITSFDNIGFAMLTVFQCITMEGWTNIMYWTDDASGNSTSWIFFVPLIIVGSFFMLNLVLGVLSGEFARERKRVEKRRRFMRMRRREHMQMELDNYIDWIATAEDAILNEEQPNDEEKMRIIECRRQAAARHLRQIRRRQKKAQHRVHQTDSTESSASQTHPHRSTIDNTIDDDDEEDDFGFQSPHQPLAWSAMSTPEVRRKHSGANVEKSESTKFDIHQQSIDHISLSIHVKRHSRVYEMLGCERVAFLQKRVRVRLRRLVKTEAWFWTVISLVFVNSFCLAIEHYNQPEWLTTFLNYSEFVFASLFLLETMIPLYAFGPRIFFMSAFRIFDTVIIFGSLFEVVWGEFSPEHSFGISVLRSLRLLRIFKLTKYWLPLRNLVLSLYNSMRSIISLLFLLFLFVLIFAMLGMQIFGGRWNFPEGRPAANFDSLPIAMMTVFQILTGEDWNEVLYCGIRSMGGVEGGGMIYSVYFILLVLFGNYTLLNVFLAIAVDNLSHARELTAAEEAGNAEKNIKKTTFKERNSTATINAEEKRKSTSTLVDMPRQAPVITDDEIVDKTATDTVMGPQPMLPVSTFFVFSPENKLRRFCHFVVNLRYFDLAIMIVIGASSLSLAAEDPIDEGADHNKVLGYVDYVFTIIFTIEMLLKMIDLGLIFHEGAYFRDLWNVLDALVVICAVSGFAITTYGDVTGTERGAASRNLNTIKAFRALRVLRPLKTINRVPKLKAVFSCVVNSLKDVTNILIVYALFQFIFSCIAVQLFKGKFFYCTDASKILPDDCQGDYFVYDLRSTLPRIEKRIWKQNDFHYDNLISAMLTLFTVTTGEGWPLVLKNSMDATHEGQGSQPGHSTETAFFYIAFFIVFPFFFINIFVALIIITFQEQGEQELADHNIDKNQKRCIEFAINARPISRHMPSNKHSFRYHIWRIVESTIFEYFIMIIICLNTLILTMKSKQLDEEKTAETETYELVLGRVNLAFTCMFSAEAVLKLIAFAPNNYFKDPWNSFDFLIVIGSIADIAVQDLLQGQSFVNFSFLRLFRAARLIKLLRLGGTVRVLLWTFVQSCKALPWVFLLIGMLFFIYAIIGMQVFGNIAIDEVTQINRHNNFRNFFTSLLLLFRCATGEAWQQVMLACLSGRPCDPVYLKSSHGTLQTCGQDLVAYAYFVSFVFLSTFLMLNLFIAVIMDNFDYLTRDASILGPHHLEEYIRAWTEYDPDATGRVHYSDMYELLRTIEPPLGFGQNCPAKLAFRKLIRMNAPLDENKTVHFNTTLFGLIRESLKIKLDVAEKMDERDRELRATIKKLWPYESKQMVDLLVPLPPAKNEDTEFQHSTTIGKIYSGIIILDNWRRFRQRANKGKFKQRETPITELYRSISHLNEQLRIDVEKADEIAKKQYRRFQKRLRRAPFMKTLADPRATSPTFPNIANALATGAFHAITTSLPMETIRQQSLDRMSTLSDGSTSQHEPVARVSSVKSPMKESAKLLAIASGATMTTAALATIVSAQSPPTTPNSGSAGELSPRRLSTIVSSNGNSNMTTPIVMEPPPVVSYASAVQKSISLNPAGVRTGRRILPQIPSTPLNTLNTLSNVCETNQEPDLPQFSKMATGEVSIKTQDHPEQLQRFFSIQTDSYMASHGDAKFQRLASIRMWQRITSDDSDQESIGKVSASSHRRELPRQVSTASRSTTNSKRPNSLSLSIDAMEIDSQVTMKPSVSERRISATASLPFATVVGEDDVFVSKAINHEPANDVKQNGRNIVIKVDEATMTTKTPLLNAGGEGLYNLGADYENRTTTPQQYVTYDESSYYYYGYDYKQHELVAPRRRRMLPALPLLKKKINSQQSNEETEANPLVVRRRLLPTVPPTPRPKENANRPPFSYWPEATAAMTPQRNNNNTAVSPLSRRSMSREDYYLSISPTQQTPYTISATTRRSLASPTPDYNTLYGGGYSPYGYGAYHQAPSTAPIVTTSPYKYYYGNQLLDFAVSAKGEALI